MASLAPPLASLSPRTPTSAFFSAHNQSYPMLTQRLLLSLCVAQNVHRSSSLISCAAASFNPLAHSIPSTSHIPGLQNSNWAVNLVRIRYDSANKAMLENSDSIQESRRNGGKIVGMAQVSDMSEPTGESASLRSSVVEPRARLVAQRTAEYTIEELQKPLAEYMCLPASQYSVLDAERIERVDQNTFRCYVHRFSFFGLEVCPVLLVQVEEQPDGCCIRLLSCTLEGSPIVKAQNKRFSASMLNRVLWSKSNHSRKARKLISNATIEVTLEIPFLFRALPVQMIEMGGSQVLGQVLRAMLPRFLAQLAKDYYAWASGDSSRRPLGTGEL